MPTYEYVCTKCHHEFEAFQSMKDRPLASCPACRRRSIKRKIGGGAGLIFKGSGFYITDYKNKKPAAGASSTDSKPAADGKPAKAESSPASSESKPAAPAKT